MKLCWSNV